MDRENNASKLLKLIKIQEGGILHRNKSESDITNGYGIYRHAYPNEEIFQYYDNIAEEIGINGKSSTWTDENIKAIQSKIDLEIEFELSKQFYLNTYFKRFKIDVFSLPEQLCLAVASILINGPKLGSKALQQSYNIILKKYTKRFPEEFKNIKPISEDGIIGDNTAKAIMILNECVLKMNHPDSVELWLSVYLSCVKSLYVELATGKSKDKYAQYLRGWVLNRVDNLIKNIDNL